MKTVEQLEDEVRRSRNAMDASTLSGRSRTAALIKELDKAKEAEREARVAPYGRNRNGVPKRPNEPCVITIQCTNPDMSRAWARFIRDQQKTLDALPIAIVHVEDWPE